MKIRNFAFVIAMLLTVAFSSSCSSENDLINEGGDGDVITRVSFSIAIPKGDPVTYAVHDADEYGIESLWLYEYDVNNTLVSLPVNIRGHLQGAGPEYTYEKKIIAKDKGVRSFLFVANENPPSNTKVGDNILTLMSSSLSKKLSNGGSSKDLFNKISGRLRIPMTGVARQGGSNTIAINGSPANVSVELTRTVARLDIDNQMRGLVITDVKLDNTYADTHLENDRTYSGVRTKVNGITPFADLPTPFDFNKQMPKAFYLYGGERGHNPNEFTSILITGTLSGVPVFYRIPFIDAQEEQPIEIQRNHIYRLTLGDGTTSVVLNNNLGFVIFDTSWNEVTMNEIYSGITVTHSGPGTWNADTHTLTLDNTAHSNIYFDLSSELAISDTPFSTSPAVFPSWISENLTGNRLTLTVEANNAPTAEAREFTLEVSVNGDQTPILVQQAK